MGKRGTQTYVNCYVTHIIGVTLLFLSPLSHLVLFYTHLYSCFIFALQHSPPEEGRTGASLVTSRVAVLTRADRAQPSCP